MDAERSRAPDPRPARPARLRADRNRNQPPPAARPAEVNYPGPPAPARHPEQDPPAIDRSERRQPAPHRTRPTRPNGGTSTPPDTPGPAHPQTPGRPTCGRARSNRPGRAPTKHRPAHCPAPTTQAGPTRQDEQSPRGCLCEAGSEPGTSRLETPSSPCAVPPDEPCTRSSPHPYDAAGFLHTATRPPPTRGLRRSRQ
jgi:hypothetical protein